MELPIRQRRIASMQGVKQARIAGQFRHRFGLQAIHEIALETSHCLLICLHCAEECERTTVLHAHLQRTNLQRRQHLVHRTLDQAG